MEPITEYRNEISQMITKFIEDLKLQPLETDFKIDDLIEVIREKSAAFAIKHPEANEQVKAINKELLQRMAMDMGTVNAAKIREAIANTVKEDYLFSSVDRAHNGLNGAGDNGSNLLGEQ